MRQIAFKSGYKYQLQADYTVDVPIKPDADIDSPYVKLTTTGELFIRKGYAWDGPSGPTVDTLNFMRGSLIHDALYQLMREEYLDTQTHRLAADVLLRQHCAEDGMNAVRCWWVYLGVRYGGEPSADPASSRPVTYAPPTAD